MARGMPLQSLVERLVGRQRALRLMLNLYAPYLGAGVRVTALSADFRAVEVELRMRWYNRNYVGTHFGGNLYTMVDPFYMLMLLNNLGPDVIVWDKAAHVRFRRPGVGTVRARFEVDDALLDGIRDRLAGGEEAFDLTLPIVVVDAEGRTVTEVDKVLHIRTKAYDRARRKERKHGLQTG